MTDAARTSLVKPTLDTPFHIDFSWWRQNDREWRVFLRGLLGEEKEAELADLNLDERVDWVDPHTGEVSQVDALQYLLSTYYTQQGDQEGGTSLIESIFRAYLKNGNSPLSSRQLGEALGRPPQTILRTLAGLRVYRGIRPVGA
ncbi:MAG TPA: hypothetical protein VI688_07695 [Anaerolineales bacterium]|nr:hypothetical protein [Anaerolineales bacterium]